jgi:alpha-1,2-mannosyltransferase
VIAELRTRLASKPPALGGPRGESAHPIRIARGVAICSLPVLVGLYVAATTFAGGTAWPWHPLMVDLDVYRQAGAAVLAGDDFYALPGLPFLYPPFAALLAVPLALLPAGVVQIGWTAAGVLTILAVLHRFGLTGWQLSLVGAATCYFVQPVRETLAYGQVGILLVALVVLDLVPGPRVLPRRILPPGTLTGIVTAVKLTPAIFVLYLIGVRRSRAAAASMITGTVATLIALVVVPGPSMEFWTRLTRGDTGLGHSIMYYTNQSVLADVIRLGGLGQTPALIGLGLSAVVALLGVCSAILWHRLGEVNLAVTLCGVAGLLASPVSWLHHFVWVVPLAICLARLSPARHRGPMPTWWQVLGWLLVGWVVAAPFRRLPSGGDLERQWTWWQHTVGSVTALLGVALILGSIAVARQLGHAHSRHAPVQLTRLDSP